MSELIKEDSMEKLDNQIKDELAKLSPEVKNSDESSKDQFLDEALKMNYDPNYSGPDKKTPEEFVKNASFFKKIKSQNRKIEELTNLVKTTMDHSTKLEKASYEKALNELRSAKENAVSEGDVVRYKAVEMQEQIVSEHLQKVENNGIYEQPKQISQELMDFKNRNEDWFNDKPENQLLVEDADYIDKRIAKEAALMGKKLSQEEHLKMVEVQVRKLHPERFPEKEKEPVLSVKSTTSASKSDSLGDRLNSSQKDFIKMARKYGSKLTDDEYAKQLQVLNELR